MLRQKKSMVYRELLNLLEHILHQAFSVLEVVANKCNQYEFDPSYGSTFHYAIDDIPMISMNLFGKALLLCQHKDLQQRICFYMIHDSWQHRNTSHSGWHMP